VGEEGVAAPLGKGLGDPPDLGDGGKGLEVVGPVDGVIGLAEVAAALPRFFTSVGVEPLQPEVGAEAAPGAGVDLRIEIEVVAEAAALGAGVVGDEGVVEVQGEGLGFGCRRFGQAWPGGPGAAAASRGPATGSATTAAGSGRPTRQGDPQDEDGAKHHSQRPLSHRRHTRLLLVRRIS
jgi:hypothetical protein